MVTSALARNQVLVGFWTGFVTLLMTSRRDGYLQIQGHQEDKEVVGMGETAAGATQEAGLGGNGPELFYHCSCTVEATHVHAGLCVPKFQQLS